MKDFAVYTAARLGVFAACYLVLVGVLLLLGGHDELSAIWPVLVAAVASTVISTYALRGLRARFAANVQARADRMVQSSDDRHR